MSKINTSATVLHMSDRRLVFALPDKGGTVVFLATGTRPVSVAHERLISDLGEAARYARELAERFHVDVIGNLNDAENIEGVA